MKGVKNAVKSWFNILKIKFQEPWFNKIKPLPGQTFHDESFIIL